MNPYNPNIPADNCASNQESSYLYQPHRSIENHNVLQYNNQSAATFNNNRGRPISCSYQPVSDLSYEKKDHVVPPMTLQSDIPLQLPQTNSLTNTAFQSKINSQFNSHWLNPCSSSDYLSFQGQHGTLSHSDPTSIHCSSILCSSNYGNPEHAFLQGQIPVFNSSNFYGCHSNHYNTGQYPSVVSSGQSFIHEPQQHDYAPQCEINDPSSPIFSVNSSKETILLDDKPVPQNKNSKKTNKSIDRNFRQRGQNAIGPQKKWSENDTKLLLKICLEQKSSNKINRKRRELEWTSIARIFKERGGVRNAHYSSCKQKYERETGYVKVTCINQLTTEQRNFLLENRHCLNKVDV